MDVSREGTHCLKGYVNLCLRLLGKLPPELQTELPTVEQLEQALDFSDQSDSQNLE